MNNVREKLVELLQENEMKFMLYLDDVATKAIKGDAYERIMDRLNFTADHLITNNVTVQEWHPASEPPKEWRRDNGEMINYLVYVPEFGVDIGNYGEPAKCWLCMGLPCKPTHWAHLPQPPKGVSG